MELRQNVARLHKEHGLIQEQLGQALGTDTCARMYTQSHGLKYTEFLPQYDQFGQRASLVYPK